MTSLQPYFEKALKRNTDNGLGIPIVENLNGIQSDPKFRLFVGMSVGLGRTRTSE